VDEVVCKIKKEIDYPSAISIERAMFDLINLEIVDVTSRMLKRLLILWKSIR
jgi:hypothetical protein